jgi:hypothetical protein
MKTGSTLLPTEMMIIHMVITVPSSPETACPTYIVPSQASVLGDSTTVDTSVSLMFHTLSAVKI